MDFINIYKLSNYIKDKTDALLARYGHVNTLADFVAGSVKTHDLNGASGNIGINMHTSFGIIKNININVGVGEFITVSNDKLTNESIIFYNLIPELDTELDELKSSLVMTKSLNPKIMTFTINPTSGDAIKGDIQFWIINP